MTCDVPNLRDRWKKGRNEPSFHAVLDLKLYGSDVSQLSGSKATKAQDVPHHIDPIMTRRSPRSNH